MASPWTRSRARWIVPVAAAGAVTAAAVLPGVSSADTHPTLPVQSAAELLTSLQQIKVQALSGTVDERANLGLPQLPGTDGAASPTSLLTGSHTLRVWADGADKQRVDLLGQTSEYVVTRSGRDLYVYDSSANTVTHELLPAVHDRVAAHAAPSRSLTDPSTLETPAAAAAAALKAIDPTTAVTVDRTALVAGHAAYQLVLTPRSAGTLVGSVRIAMDSATHVPLRVQVFAAGATTPAIEVGFTSVSFSAPAASVFDAPGGTLVTPSAEAAKPAGHDAHPGDRAATATDDASKPTVKGTGWASIVELPAGTAAGAQDRNGAQSRTATKELDALTTKVAGGRGVQTALVSVLLANDGRMLVGAVPLTALSAAAG